MNADLQVLAIGNSSVSGVKWFFVGVNRNQMAAVTSDQYYSDDDQKAWTVLLYSPGCTQQEWKEITGELAQRIIDACRHHKCDRQIDWNNKVAIRDLYWEFKE